MWFCCRFGVRSGFSSRVLGYHGRQSFATPTVQKFGRSRPVATSLDHTCRAAIGKCPAPKHARCSPCESCGLHGLCPNSDNTPTFRRIKHQFSLGLASPCSNRRVGMPHPTLSRHSFGAGPRFPRIRPPDPHRRGGAWPRI